MGGWSKETGVPFTLTPISEANTFVPASITITKERVTATIILLNSAMKKPAF